jgi:uncharacterized integral membrane protein
VAGDDLNLDELTEETPEPAAPPAKAEKPAGEPGFFGRLLGKITRPFANLRPAELLSPRAIGILIAAALVVWLLAANLAPVRIVLLFWTVDIPKALAFLLDVALGAVLMWLWLRPKAAKKPAEGTK